MLEKLKILFLCTGNSCRSQMAEGFARQLKADSIAAASAGVVKSGLDPRAATVMAEIGVDISAQTSKLIEELPDKNFHYVITLCDQARQACPVFPGTAVMVHKGFPDPPTLAMGAKSQEEALGHYRRVRDQIRRFVEDLPVGLPPRREIPMPVF